MTPIDHTLRALRLADLGLEQSGGSLWYDDQEVALFVQNAVTAAVGDGLINEDRTLAPPGRELLGRLNRGYTASLDAMGWTRAQFSSTARSISALGPYAGLAQQVYDVAVGLPDYGKRKAEKLSVWAFTDGGQTEAHHRIVDAAQVAGRYEPAFGLHGRWGVSIVRDAFHGAWNVQLAVLCRDLISDQDYRTMLGWWVKAGQVDPHGVVTR